MIIPPENFNRFAIKFDDEIADDYETDEEFVAIQSRSATRLSPSEEAAVRDFLTHLIEGDYTDDELEEFWASTSTNSEFKGYYLRQFLPIMRDNIGLPLPPEYLGPRPRKAWD